MFVVKSKNNNNNEVGCKSLLRNGFDSTSLNFQYRDTEPVEKTEIGRLNILS